MKRVLLTVAVAAFSTSAFAGDAPVTPGWFGYIEGSWLAKTNTGNQEESNFAGHYTTASTGDGWDAGAKIGYRFNGAWDIAVAGRYIRQDSGNIEKDTFGWQFQNGKYWNADLEFGNTVREKDGTVRFFFGARYQDYRADFHDQEPPVFADSEKSSGIGPRIGIEVTKPLWTNVSMFGAIDGSALFGTVKDSKNSAFLNSSRSDGSDSRTFYDAGARIGVNFALASQTNLAIGFKVEALDGINFNSMSDRALAVGPPSGAAMS